MFLKKFVPLSILLLAIIAGCSLFVKPAENISMIGLFSDNMVLQRNAPIPVFGEASANGKVVVKIDNMTKSVIVGKDSTWRVMLPKMEAGGPHVLQVIGKDTLTFNNVMVGEVWVCSGQSNMEMPIAGWGKINNYLEEIQNATHPNIRLITVTKAISPFPLKSFQTDGWLECGPETVPQFSATAYFFGKKLSEALDIPIGLIHTSWGGTLAEAWTSANGLKTMEDFAAIVDSMDTRETSVEEMQKIYDEKMIKWQKALDAKIAQVQGAGEGWEKQELKDNDWLYMNLPVLWEQAGLPNFDGVVWFRKEIDVPANLAGKDLLLQLGLIDDSDITWFNGVQVGATNAYDAQRKYVIPGNLVKKGKNVVAVQVLDTGGGGGIWGAPEQMTLGVGKGKNINLAGIWKYKAGVELKDVPMRPISPVNPNQPTVLYNAMINPLIPYGIRGAIWYQGEANENRAYQYRTLFPTMIQDWRTNWGLGDFPFIFTQLANFRPTAAQPGEDNWAELREAQMMTLALPNTGMAVTIDIGDGADIHPKNKQDVGLRLALNALNKVYEMSDVVPCGPLYKSMAVDGNKIKLSFDYVGGGLEARGEKLLGFAIAGEDQKFVWADAEIAGEEVVVSSPYVPNPVSVRYAWASNPICNLYNKAGLPASPFRTDDWPGMTVNNK